MVKIDPGEMDRLIAIEQITGQGSAISDGGSETWGTLATVWAKVEALGARERFSSAAIHTTRVNIFTILYRTDLDSKQRIDYESKKWRITGIKELGYKELHEVTAEVIE